MPRDRISRFGGKMLPLRRKSAREASKIHSDLGKRCKNCGEELRGGVLTVLLVTGDVWK